MINLFFYERAEMSSFLYESYALVRKSDFYHLLCSFASEWNQYVCFRINNIIPNTCSLDCLLELQLPLCVVWERVTICAY